MHFGAFLKNMLLGASDLLPPIRLELYIENTQVDNLNSLFCVTIQIKVNRFFDSF